MRLAIYHDLPSGGAKRTLFEVMCRLRSAHSLDVYTLSGACHTFCDIRPLARHHFVFDFQSSPLFPRPYGRLNQLQRWRDLGRLDRIGRRIATTVDRGGYDLVFAHPSMWTQAPLLLRHLRTPSVYYLQEPLRQSYEPRISRPYENHGWSRQLDRVDPLIRLYHRRQAKLDRDGTRRAGRRLVNSRFTSEGVARAYGCSAELSYLGVNTESFRPLAGSREDYVLSVGALRPNKGFDFVIKALACLPKVKRPAFHIVANADDPAERGYLMALAARHEVRLTIEAMVDHATLVRRYNAAALVVYAPIREPFGLVTLEALACATPVVAVGEGGVKEVMIHGVTGCVTERDLHAFAESVASLLANPELATRYGRQGRAHVLENWTWEQSVQRLEAQLCAAAAPRDEA